MSAHVAPAYQSYPVQQAPHVVQPTVISPNCPETMSHYSDPRHWFTLGLVAMGFLAPLVNKRAQYLLFKHDDVLQNFPWIVSVIGALYLISSIVIVYTFPRYSRYFYSNLTKKAVLVPVSQPSPTPEQPLARTTPVSRRGRTTYLVQALIPLILVGACFLVLSNHFEPVNHVMHDYFQHHLKPHHDRHQNTTDDMIVPKTDDDFMPPERDNSTRPFPPHDKNTRPDDKNSTRPFPPPHDGDKNSTRPFPPPHDGDKNSTRPFPPPHDGDKNSTRPFPHNDDKKSTRPSRLFALLSSDKNSTRPFPPPPRPDDKNSTRPLPPRPDDKNSTRPFPPPPHDGEEEDSTRPFPPPHPHDEDDQSEDVASFSTLQSEGQGKQRPNKDEQQQDRTQDGKQRDQKDQKGGKKDQKGDKKDQKGGKKDQKGGKKDQKQHDGKMQKKDQKDKWHLVTPEFAVIYVSLLAACAWTLFCAFLVAIIHFRQHKSYFEWTAMGCPTSPHPVGSELHAAPAPIAPVAPVASAHVEPALPYQQQHAQPVYMAPPTYQQQRPNTPAAGYPQLQAYAQVAPVVHAQPQQPMYQPRTSQYVPPTIAPVNNKEGYQPFIDQEQAHNPNIQQSYASIGTQGSVNYGGYNA